jgi:hypothetical protein
MKGKSEDNIDERRPRHTEKNLKKESERYSSLPRVRRDSGSQRERSRERGRQDSHHETMKRSHRRGSRSRSRSRSGDRSRRQRDREDRSYKDRR